MLLALAPTSETNETERVMPPLQSVERVTMARRRGEQTLVAELERSWSSSSAMIVFQY